MSNTQKTNAPVAGKQAALGLMEIIKNTKPQEILGLELVKKRFIQNYNLCNSGNMGDVMYHRQQVFLRQMIAEDKGLANADPMSIYKAIVTLGAKGWSVDPQDKDVYMLAKGGKVVLWPQAQAHIRRLLNNKLIVYADQPKLVMEGDFFEEENGKVKHIAKRQSKKIIAGYIRFVLDDRGTEKYIVYDESDWESWRNESQQKDGKNWRGNDGQPNPGFLRTKLIKHAAMDTSWPSGSTPVGMETYNDVIDEEIAYEELPKTETKVETIAEPVKPTKQEAETIEVVDEEMNFADDKQAEEGTTIIDEQIDMEFN
jgi:hypothetical protein